MQLTMAERHVALGKLYDDVNSKAQKLLGLYLEMTLLNN